MKVAMGMKLQEGAFGGGNQFARQLVDYLKTQNHQVTFSLADKDIDIILMTDPRGYLGHTNFSPREIAEYIALHPKAIVIHRVNECDERKDTRFMNRKLILGNQVADHTIYVSGWLKGLFDRYGMNEKSHSVILNGADEKDFYWEKRSLPSKARIVTHHFSAHYMKGWDIYLELDRLIGKPEWENKIEFHYIGNPLKDAPTKNTIYHRPGHGKDLAKLIGENHLYITGSLHEPGSNHQLEGALLGLPLLWRRSGGLAETCEGFGIEIFGVAHVEEALKKIISNYDFFQNKLKEYPYTGLNMCRNYLETFDKLLIKREELILKRKRVSPFIMGTMMNGYRVLDRLGFY